METLFHTLNLHPGEFWYGWSWIVGWSIYLVMLKSIFEFDVEFFYFPYEAFFIIGDTDKYVILFVEDIL